MGGSPSETSNASCSAHRRGDGALIVISRALDVESAHLLRAAELGEARVEPLPKLRGVERGERILVLECLEHSSGFARPPRNQVLRIVIQQSDRQMLDGSLGDGATHVAQLACAWGGARREPD